jgi:hypothetical protein
MGKKKATPKTAHMTAIAIAVGITDFNSFHGPFVDE